MKNSHKRNGRDFDKSMALSISVMKYVRDQLVLAAALITKRSLFDVSDQDREAILLHIKQLLQLDADNAVRNASQRYIFVFH